MNKKLLFILSCFLVLSSNTIFGQCTINTANTTNGWTPASLPCINQGTPFGEAVQIRVPGTISTFTLDSVKITSISGLPAGITYAVNPTNAIPGNGNGCVWYSGTTNAPAGNYPLTIRGTAWVKAGPIQLPIDTTLNTFGFGYSLTVCAPQVTEVCDTSFNINLFLTIYGAPGTSGYFSGNNGYGDKAKAEKFSRTPNSKIKNGIYLFYRAKDGATADSVWFKAWDDSGAGGSPGATLDSVKVPIAAIATAITNNPQGIGTVVVAFPTEPVSTSGNFFLGVDLPTVAGDTLVLFTDTLTSFGGGRGWEKYSNDTWHPYTDYGFPDSTDQLGNSIAALTCGPPAKPDADFTASPTAGCGSVTTEFTDASTNTPTSWAWTFTGGVPATSTDQNPIVVFSGSGSYNVTLIATNANGSDTITKNGYITVSAPVLVSLTPTSANCGASDGAVTSNATGGNNTYSYAWSGRSDTTANLTGVPAGTYVVTVTSNGCSATAGATVGNVSTLTATTASVPAATSVSSDGTATVTATGGTAPYTYAWSNGQTTATATGLDDGTYTVTVTDAQNCSSIHSVTVTVLVGLNDVETADMTFSVAPNPATNSLRINFSNQVEGTGAIYGVDGKLFTTFSINNQIEVVDIVTLPAGVYIVQVKDKKSISTSQARVVKY
jgi:PKD repeat protein